MYYALISYTNLESEGLNNFRRKYDPWVDLIKDHLTLIFPIPDSIGLNNLVDHIQDIITDKQTFDIHISGLEKSWDNFLLLTIKEGNKNIIELFDQFYTGILAPYIRKDLKFIPHIGLGLFVKEDYDILAPKELALDEKRFKDALDEALKLKFDFWRKVDKLTLVKLNKDFTKLWDIKEFSLI